MENIKESPLCKFAYKYKTDKCPRIKHSYTPIYYELLKGRRKSVKKVFEMGVFLGASLRMWRDFFPNAQVYGGDIEPEQMFEEERVKTFVVDENDENQAVNLIKKLGDIDLFVHDAIHKFTTTTDSTK